VRSGLARGLRLEIDPRDEKYYWSGAYEPSVQQALGENIMTGAVCWDIGAHIGFFALLASRLVGPTGLVHAFEPVHENRQRLVRNLALNRATNLYIHGCAVGEHIGTAALRRHERSSMWSVVAVGDGGPPIKIVTLDSLLRQLGPPQLVKIDVEGMEVEVLRGGRMLLGEIEPVLVVEYSAPQGIAEGQRVLDNYIARALTSSHWLYTPRSQSRRASTHR